MSSDLEMFENRLRKNARHFKKWAQRRGLAAYRVYDRDMPDYPFVVEWYAGRIHLVEYPRRRDRDGHGSQREEVLATVMRVLEAGAEQVFTKTHLPQPWGKSQYQREGHDGERFEVEEQGLKFWVNLTDHLDSGLFLDHRLTRARVREEAAGKRFLNLFAYTGSFTVYAAAGGATRTTSVDLSNRACEWTEANLALNRLAGPNHQVVRADVVRWLRQTPERFDLVVLDPPSFSASKKMAGRFNVQEDHPRLIADVLALLAPGGVLYFSTNYQGFSLATDLPPGSRWEELTPRSLPEDFHPEVHRCWRIQR